MRTFPLKKKWDKKNLEIRKAESKQRQRIAKLYLFS